MGKKVGIKWKLFASFAVFTVVTILILWLCMVVFLGEIYRSEKTAEIKSAAVKLSYGINNQDELDELCQSVSNKSDVCILILRMYDDNTAQKICSSDALKHCAIHNMQQSGYFTLYDLTVKNEGHSLQHYRYDSIHKKYISIEPGKNQGDPESIIFTLLVKDRDGNDILIILNSIVTPVEATVNTLNMILIFVTVIMLLISLLLAALISRAIARPIIKINDSAKLLAERKYDVDFTEDSFREIHELSSTLKYAATELSKVDSLRRELIANTSHDLRTPLTLIKGYAEVMRDLPGENTPDNAQVIIDESQRLSSLVNDMLDISKLESGNFTLNKEYFSLTKTLADGMERYNQLRTSEGYHIEFIADRDVTVFTDKSKLLQAFYNLVNNAITYTGADKLVTVLQHVYSDEKDGRTWVRISVTDTGEGIPEDKLSLIWDRYYKVDSAHKRAAQGTGLGLSIVNKIMELLGGRCGVSSKLGVGSTFMIEIPTESSETVLDRISSSN